MTSQCGIPVAARFKARMVLAGDLIGWLASIAIILSRPHSFAALFIGTIGLGISMASIYPTVLTIAEQRMKITGQITGFFIVGASLGAMILPFVVGQLFASIGPQVLMFAGLVDFRLAAIVFALLNFSRRQLATAAAPERELSVTSD